MSQTPAIAVSGIDKTYRIYDSPRSRLLEKLLPMAGRRHTEFRALERTTFSLDRGEKVGIIGRNGSGKSTLLRIIAGTLKPTSGTVERRGTIAALLELGAGFNPEFTGRQNLSLNLAILGGAEQARDKDRIARIIEFADLGAFIDRQVKLYSSGMYLRLAFAVAIHVDAEIIIIDEALAVGDFAFQARCLRKLDALSDEGKTILLVSHDIAQVRRFCNRAVYLRAGRLISIGDVASVCDDYFAETSLPADLEPTKALGSADRTPKGDLYRKFEEGVANRQGEQRLAKILAVTLNGFAGESPPVMFDEKIEVDIEYETYGSVSNLTVALYVVDVAGQAIVGTNTFYEGLELGATPGRAGVRISFQNRLKDGDYALSISISSFFPEAQTTFEDYIPMTAHFRSVVAPSIKRWAFYSPQFATSSYAIE